MSDMIDVTVLQMTRTFDAPSSRVLDAWLNREAWQAWMGPEGVRAEAVVLEPWAGGRYRVLMHRPHGTTLAVAGVYESIERPAGLAFTWAWNGDAQETLVRVALRDFDGRTELTLHHEGFATAAALDSHNSGWAGSLDKLDRYLSRGGVTSVSSEG